MKRDPIFASSISVSNFRGYGKDFRLDLPSGPCVVLLSGPNGLGKTSLFEAIEWTLTDNVERLNTVKRGRADRRDLARRAPGVDSFEAALHFVDAKGEEEKIDRAQLIVKSATQPDSVGTKLDRVAEYLRADDLKWSVNGTNIGGYLHLTHLHAQVAALRLVTFASKDRWLKVSPLAGAERFERVRTNLMNSKQALTQLVQRRTEDLGRAEARLNQWADLVLRLAQAQTLASVVRAAMTPREISERVVTAARKLALPMATSLAATDDVVAAGEALRTLRDAIESATLAEEDRQKRLAGLRVRVREYSDLRAQLEALHPRLQQLGDAVAKARSAADAAAQAARQAREQHTKDRATLEAASKRHESLLAAQHVNENLARLQTELDESAGKLRAFERAVEEAEVEHRRRLVDVEAHEKSELESERHRRRLSLVDEGTAAVNEIEALQKQLAIENDRKLAFEATMRATASSALVLAEERTTTEKAIADAQLEVEKLRAAADDFQRALVIVAQHISNDDVNCPVCHTAFEPSRLRALATKTVEHSNPRFKTSEARLAALGTAHETLVRRGAQLSRDARKAAADLRAAVEKIAQITTRIQELKSKEPLNVMAGGDYRAGLARVRDDATKHLALIRAAADARGSVDVLRQAVVDAAAKVGEAKRARALEQERHAVRQAQLSELKGLEANLLKDGVLENSRDLLLRSINEAAATVAAARKAADAATQKQAEASAADAAAQKAVAAASDELARAAPLRATMEERLARYEQEWSGARFSLPLSETTLDVEQERLDSRRTQLDAEASAIPPMSGALQNWQDSLDLQRLEMQVREAHGAIGREEHTKVLEAAVITAKKARDDAERARAAAEDLNDRLQGVTAEFGGIALKPFGELFKRYLKALIHDERFHNIEAVYAPSARSAGLSFRVLFGGAATEAEYLLSEGQLGEVSLAAMLAASTAFPWSRWRALLLDDPTQYNDLIHATALYDVLRNLVSRAGYQVFLSTHDQEQADFIRRKLDAVGIRWVDCRFRGHTADGIDVSIVQSRGAEKVV